MTKGFVKRELLGAIYLSAIVFVVTAGLFLYEKINPYYALTHVGISGQDGSGRRSMFVAWLLLLFCFTLANCIFTAFKSLRKSLKK